MRYDFVLLARLYGKYWNSESFKIHLYLTIYYALFDTSVRAVPHYVYVLDAAEVF